MMSTHEFTILRIFLSFLKNVFLFRNFIYPFLEIRRYTQFVQVGVCEREAFVFLKRDCIVGIYLGHVIFLCSFLDA